MIQKFTHISEMRAFLTERLSDDAFLGRKGYTIRGASRHYIMPYPPEQEVEAQELIRAISLDLPAHGANPLIVDLYDIILAHLDGEGMWEGACALEEEYERNDVIMTLQDTLTVRGVIAPAIKDQIERSPEADLCIITGVGATYPFIRTHTLFEELTTSIPIVLAFPGRYAQRADGSTSLDILGLDQSTSGGRYPVTDVFEL